MGTVDVRINEIDDDGTAYGGDSSIRVSANICWGTAGGDDQTYSTYLLFEGITIPAGATITESWIEFNEGVNVGTPGARIYFEDVAAPERPTTFAGFYAKTKTTNYVAIGSITGTQKSNSLNDVIQELVDSHAPYRNGAMQALIIYTSAKGNYCIPKSYDNDTSLCPRLYIEFTPPRFKGTQVIIV